MRKLTLLCAGPLLAASALAPAHADEPGSAQTRNFLEEASSSDAFEISEAQTALAESKDPRVLSFAQQMIRDHEATNRALRDAATRAGLKPPPLAVGTAQAPLLAALQSLRGRDFDQAYFKHQALAHRSALTVEQHYAASGDQPAIRQAAASATPIISAHLAMAERMQAQLGGS